MFTDCMVVNCFLCHSVCIYYSSQKRCNSAAMDVPGTAASVVMHLVGMKVLKKGSAKTISATRAS